MYTLGYFQGMTPIAKIEIAIPIPIWKTMCDPIAIAAPQSRDLLDDLSIYRLMETFVIK